MKQEFRSSAESINKDEFDKFWTELYFFIKKMTKPLLHETAQQEGGVKEHTVASIIAVIDLVKHCLTLDTIPDSFTTVFSFLNGMLCIINCHEVRNINTSIKKFQYLRSY